VATVLAMAGAGADEVGHRHRRFAKDIDAFHAVLASVWHARPGAERSRNACAKAAEMAGLAREIRSADAGALNSALAALQAGCAAPSSDIDGLLFDLHEAFHRLIEGR